jgi:hypothetical protein
MVIKTASPGVLINEIDLTRGTSDAITTNIGALCGPFQKGPVDQIIKINTEAELQTTFGDPTDENYEYWWTVSNFLEYGGVCYVVRVDDAIGDEAADALGLTEVGTQKMRNAVDILDINLESVYVKNKDHFLQDVFEQGLTEARFISRDPGKWGNAIGIATIDAGADYQSVLSVTNIRDGDFDVSVADETQFSQLLDNGEEIGKYIKFTLDQNPWDAYLTDDDTVFPVYVEAIEPPETGGLLDGKGYITSYSNGVFQVMVTTGNWQKGDTVRFDERTLNQGFGILDEIYDVGTHVLYNPNLIDADLLAETGLVLDTDQDTDTLLAEYVVPGAPTDRIVSSIWKPQTYGVLDGFNMFGWPRNPRNNQKAFLLGPGKLGETYIYNNRSELWTNSYKPAGGDTLYDGDNVFTIEYIGDWYNNQIAFQGLPWYRFASRPGTSLNAQDRGATNDEMNVIVYDATGDITGSKGNVLEAYIGVSKLKGATSPEGELNYYSDRINEFSGFIYANFPFELAKGGLNQGKSPIGFPIGDGVDAGYIVPGSRQLKGGVDNLMATLGEVQYGYNKFGIENVFDLDYILQGPAGSNIDDAVAKANFIISVVEERRDCMCFLSPPKYMVVNQSSATQVTVNINEWANELSSSSYSVFDSGYKYQYDRYNDKYRYVPLNGDVAGTLVYAAFRAEPWFSPAGFSRGQIRNVVKLPYNPSRKQRDDLYTHRVNPVVDFPGEGTVLYGDKTGLAYSSAFDRINVRRLFLIVEKEIAKISKTTLFEFNDEITRTLFKNNVNPFLRNVQAKRGMYDFLVVCDDSNNSPEIIDRNEFVADIYIKPARSINFITLNFVATKTGVTFDEAVGLHRRNSF